MPRFPRLRAALIRTASAAVRASEAVAANVDVDELARIAVTAAVSGGNPAAVAREVGLAVLAGLPSILTDPTHQAAAADVLKAAESVGQAIARARSAPAS